MYFYRDEVESGMNDENIPNYVPSLIKGIRKILDKALDSKRLV